MTRLVLWFALVLSVAGLAPPAGAQAPLQLDRLQRADGARIVPEKFLRSWDPVTLFFDRDVGPANGGPEDAPERLVTMRPATAGAWQWLGPRALQFRPADAWKPLQAIEIAADGTRMRLVPLLPVPVSASPTDQAEGIADLDQVALTFEDPVDVAALSRLLSIELRPAPGLGRTGGQVLSPGDFSVEPLERGKRSDKQTYLVKLKSPVPDGRLLVLRLKLSDQPGLDDPSFETQLHSAVPFTATGARCGRGLDRETVDGVMQCSQSDTSSSSSDDEERPGARIVRRRMAVNFSAKPQPLDVVQAREALRITPAVADLKVEPDGSRLQVSGRFLAETVYELRIAPGSILDQRQRRLEGAPFVQKFAFAADTPSLKWDANQGIVERFGPQLVPLRGGGYDRADMRIHAIDPLSRDFWPFPRAGVETNDDESPPLPGNEPERWTEVADAAAAAIAARIKALGSPAVSELLPLPIQRGSIEAKFGLDLKPLFAKVSPAPSSPATYLVGLRPVDGGKRRWLRVQVTDLTLSTIEEAEPGALRHHLARHRAADCRRRDPPGGRARQELRHAGARAHRRRTAHSPGPRPRRAEAEIKRIVVTKGLDTLVLEPGNGPSEYSSENWTKPENRLAVLDGQPRHRSQRGPARGSATCSSSGRSTGRRSRSTSRATSALISAESCRLPAAAERSSCPVRAIRNGASRSSSTPWAAFITSSTRRRRRPATTRHGSSRTATPNRATGPSRTMTASTPNQARAAARPRSRRKPIGCRPSRSCSTRPQRVALDGEFSVDVLARYFAGGLVADRPVKLRATQFPYPWTPPAREGFLFSTDARFSSDGKFKSTPVLERDGRTDAGGSARITFDTTIEPTAQPRRYLIEATVTGDDDIQVRNLRSVVALPAFVLGVKVPRYLPQSGAVEPEILAVDAEGQPRAGIPLTVRLIRRNWISTLQASDFSQGAAKYVTQVIDETVVERKMTSAAEVQKLAFEAREAGVYLVQIEASDRIGRRQQVTRRLLRRRRHPGDLGAPAGADRRR